MKKFLGILMLGGLLMNIPLHSFTQNIALNKTVVTSSVQSSSYKGNLAVDGSTSTRWASAASDPQWIYVDLGNQYNITSVKITWASAYGKNYTIDISNNATSWSTIKSVTGNTSLTNTNSVTGAGRYVRVYGMLRGTTSGYSIYELQVYGSLITGGSCGTTTALSSSSITTTTATVSWTAVSGAVTYNLQWKASSSSTWTTVSGITTTSSNLTGLAPGSTYQFQVQTVCSAGSSAYSSSASFNTIASCGIPTGLTSSNIANTSATVSWDAMPGAATYNLQWKASSSSSWTTISGITTTSNNLTGLTAGTTYQFQVQTVCSAGSSSYSSATSFTTASGSSTSSSNGITSATGKTYYFSSSTGDDSRTSTQAQSSSTPWKTLNKLNSFFSSLQPGDLVLFKRGDVFPGSITATISGTSSAPIAFSAYGTGAKPIINGFTTLTSSAWTSTGNGLYEAVVSAGLSSLNMVTLDGAFQVMGKYPKGNTGYLTVGSGNTSSISSSGLSGIPSFSGGEIVWRPSHWSMWRATVNSQSSKSVSFTPFTSTSGGSTEAPAAGYGFFFQNHPNACTSLGEWAYTSSTHKITMYFGASGPGSHVVNVSSIENLITLSGRSYITFDNIALQGANTRSFSITNSNNIIINACDILFSGQDAINANSACSNITVTNCNVSYSNFNGIVAAGSIAWNITGNIISNTASVAGMGGTGEGQYFGIRDVKNGSTVALNKITNTGYISISFQGTNNTILNNLIDTFCTVKDDGGGIYCGGEAFTGTKVTGNIVFNGIGALAGTPDADARTHGIYIDDNGSGVEIGGNTVAYCQYSGLNNHNGHDLNIHDNTMFANGSTGISYYNDGNTIANITLTGNIFFAKASSALVSDASGGSASPAGFFSTANNNYWCRPLSEGNTIQTYISSKLINYTLATWKTLTGKETNSKTSPITFTDVNRIRFEYNASSSSKTISLGGNYIDARSTAYTSITLAPFTSAILMNTAGSTTQSAARAEVADQNNLTEKPTFTIYPNPVTDNFVLQLNNSQTGKMNIQIVNQAGAIVRSYMFSKSQVVDQITLSANDLPTGVYFVHVQIGTWSDKRKMVKL